MRLMVNCSIQQHFMVMIASPFKEQLAVLKNYPICKVIKLLKAYVHFAMRKLYHPVTVHQSVVVNWVTKHVSPPPPVTHKLWVITLVRLFIVVVDSFRLRLLVQKQPDSYVFKSIDIRMCHLHNAYWKCRWHNWKCIALTNRIVENKEQLLCGTNNVKHYTQVEVVRYTFNRKCVSSTSSSLCATITVLNPIHKLEQLCACIGSSVPTTQVVVEVLLQQYLM